MGEHADIGSVSTEKAMNMAQAMTDVVTTVDLILTSDPIRSHIMFIATRKFEAITREIATNILQSLASLREQGKQNEE